MSSWTRWTLDTIESNTAKRTARLKTTLTKRTVEALKPDLKPWIAWDDRLTGFGVRGDDRGEVVPDQTHSDSSARSDVFMIGVNVAF